MARSRTWRKYRGWIAVGVLMVAIIGVFLVMRNAKAAENDAAPTYTTEAAAKGTISLTVSGTGNLELAETSDVYPQTSGTVATVDVKEGQQVEAGDVLYTLDADDAEAATSKAYASYVQSKQGVTQAESQLIKANAALDDLEDRADDESSTVTSSDLKAAKKDVAAAEEGLESAEVQESTAYETYADAKSAEDELEIAAPIDGKVWALNIEEGDSVSASGSSSSSGSDSSGSDASAANSSGASTGNSSSAPVVLTPNEPLVVNLSVNEVDVPSIKKAQRADITFDALPDLTLTGQVTGVSDEGTVSSGVVTFDVEITLDVTDKKLKPGMSTAATIVTKVARDALLVPNSAVQSDTSGGDYMQVLEKGSTTPKQVTVEVGIANETQTQILSGLEEGDLVVTKTTSSGSDGSGSGSGSSGGSTRGGGFMMPGIGGPPGGRD